MMKSFLLKILAIGMITSFAWASEEVAIGEAPEVVLAVAPKAENEIPLTVEVTKKVAESTPPSTRLMMTAFILITILGATYYLVRKYKLSNNINKSNKQIQVLSQHYLGPKKSLAIIRVAGESILIGVTDSNISMIKSLSLIDDEVPAEIPRNFSETLQFKTQPAAGATANQEELEEEFSFAGVKDTVSKKIKSMRSFS